MNAQIRREQAGWEWDLIKEVSEAPSTHMEVIASAASQAVHPDGPGKAGSGTSRTGRRDWIHTDPPLDTPVAVPAEHLQRHRGYVKPQNGKPDRFMYVTSRPVNFADQLGCFVY